MSSYRQMRRQARHIRRGGMQPVFMINGGGPGDLPALAGAALARLAWRYRSELAPLAVAVALAAAGGWLHAAHPGAAVPVLAASLAAAGAALAFGARAGLARPAERAYAGAVLLAGGAWLALAAAIGPLSAPLPAALGIGGLVLAVPWWAHRRRRAKVRVDRTLAAWPDMARAVGLAGSAVMSATVDVWGWRARFRLARGQTITDVIARVPAIESALGTFRGAVRVYPTPDDRANRFELRVLDTDPHADAIPWPGPSIGSIAEPAELGPFEDASPCRLLFLRRHALIGGIAGSGKSGGLNVIMGNLTACPDVVVWAIDLKRGMELGPWTECIGRLAVTPEQAAALLRDAVTILKARAEHLAGAGRRTWEPSPDMPALVIVIDEYAELTEEAPEAAHYADEVARLGRALAVTLIAATQRPTQKVMGQGAVRSQMDLRVCFRVREQRDVDLVLGQGMLKAGWNAHQLNAPGKFLVSAPEHETPRRARAYLLTDETVALTAARHSRIPRELDEVSRNSLTRPTGRAPRFQPEYESTGNTAGSPEEILWRALRSAPAEGWEFGELIRITGMPKTTLYRRLREHAENGRAYQVSHGRWRARPAEGESR